MLLGAIALFIAGHYYKIVPFLIWYHRFGPLVLLYPAFVAMPVSFALLAVTQTRSQMIVAAILFGIGLGASFPSFVAFVVANTD